MSDVTTEGIRKACAYVTVTIGDNSPQAIVMEFVVAGEGYQASPARRERKENLHCGIAPNLLQKHHKMKQVLTLFGHQPPHSLAIVLEGSVSG